MKYQKKKLLAIAEKIQESQAVTPEEASIMLTFEKVDKKNRYISLLKNSQVPLAITLGFFIAVFPLYFESLTTRLPSWTNMPEPVANGLDYIWGIIGSPIREQNIIYHIPNFILYSFGIVGLKKLFEALEKRNWMDKVFSAKTLVEERTKNGTLGLRLKKGHSVVFLGKGDFIGMQFILNLPSSQSIALSEIKPSYTNIWNYYNAETGYDDLKLVLERTYEDEAGEYIFFPVKDDQIFLPSPTAYDLSPHKLDILCQDIRTIEKKNKWKKKRIIIVGDRNHKSFVQSEDKMKKIKGSEDEISLKTIASKYENITLLDPTEIVLKKVLEIAKGRKIVFRATKQGIKEYKQRFYSRIEELGYKTKQKAEGILTIGYDLFEDQTEQQTLARKIDDYYPVVLSKVVRDALIRNGYKSSDFIYVPDLVLSTLTKKASEQ